jgi:hypothetical protein
MTNENIKASIEPQKPATASSTPQQQNQNQPKPVNDKPAEQAK